MYSSGSERSSCHTRATSATYVRRPSWPRYGSSRPASPPGGGMKTMSGSATASSASVSRRLNASNSFRTISVFRPMSSLVRRGAGPCLRAVPRVSSAPLGGILDRLVRGLARRRHALRRAVRLRDRGTAQPREERREQQQGEADHDDRHEPQRTGDPDQDQQHDDDEEDAEEDGAGHGHDVPVWRARLTRHRSPAGAPAAAPS